MTFVDTHGDDQCRNLWVTHFLGHTAVQYWSDFMLWDRFLDAYPAKRLIELGTGAGGLSLYLALECIQRGMRFDTFDSFLPEIARSNVGRLVGLEGMCHVGNLWTEAGEWLRKMLAEAEHPLILACDNGDKPREVTLFGPLLKAGDLLCVHDYHNEYDDNQAPAELQPRLKGVFEDEAKQLGSMWRWYQVT